MAPKDSVDPALKTARLRGVLFLLGLAVLLECASRWRIMSPLYFPPVSIVIRSFIELTLNGTLLKEVLGSLARMMCGYGLTIVTMVPLGILIATSKSLHHAVGTLLEVLRPLPPPALIPVVMLFLGAGELMRVLVVFFACSVLILTNTMDASKAVRPLFIQTGKALGLSRMELLWKILLPAATPQILSGLKTSLPIALIVTLLTEMIGSDSGIGYWILRMQRTFSIPEMYAGILMLGLFSFLFNKLFVWFDRRYLAWHQGWKRAGR